MRWFKRLLKRLVGTRAFQKTVAVLAAEYLRLVWKTTRFTVEPEGIYERGLAEAPVIVCAWHGQHFLTVFLGRVGDTPGKVLVSTHRDGEINALVVERLGLGTVRGSGDHGREFHRKGGVSAFREMLNALAEGYNIGLSADVPKVSRVAGLGIIKLASESGRPIQIMAIATRFRIVLDTWDRSVVNLPFGRGAIVGGGPYFVPRDADDATLEAARRKLEDALNAATARAYEIVDGPGGARSGA